MADETKTETPEKTTQETQPDELAGLSLEALETEETSTPNILEQKIKVGDEEIPISQLSEWYKNNQDWQAKNHRESQKLNEEKKRIEEEQRRIAAESSRFQQTQSRETEPETIIEDTLSSLDDFDDPTVKTLKSHALKQTEIINKLAAEIDSFKKQRETDQFNYQNQSEHGRLRQKYGEIYNPEEIEKQVLNGLSWYEQVHLANQLQQMQSNPEAMFKAIPETYLKSYRDKVYKEIKQQVLQDLRQKAQASKNVSSIPTIPGGVKKETVQVPKTYREATEAALNDLKELGISLTH